MPVVFAPLVFQGLIAAARAAVPNVVRFFTQATAAASRNTAAVGNAARAAGPLPFVAGGVGAAAGIASGFGLIPSIKPGIPQSLLKPDYMKPGPPSSQTTLSDHTLGDFVVRGGGAGSGGGAAPQPQTVVAPEVISPPPEPPPPPPPPDPPTFQAVKAAPIDTVTFVDEPYSEGFYEDILFQDFGGQELLSISRSDTVNGQRVSYQPFRDLGIIRDQYNPSSLLSIQETSDRFFANFLIKLNEKIPNVGNGPNGKNIYFDSSTGDGIIELVNVETDEQVEIQILNAGIIEDIGI
jgi:hypothetical protein